MSMWIVRKFIALVVLSHAVRAVDLICLTDVEKYYGGLIGLTDRLHSKEIAEAIVAENSYLW